ncbi:MAG: methionyl-tRNA formyltransferase [Oscillospiraceae bacterium]|nr:methionyl-tRNA formyltransferase [Oscillospiraceae bacterium]
MRILFMGTPEFAKISLEYLVKNKFDVIGVITQPDKPAGRKMILTPPPVKEYAVSENISVYQPQSLRTEEFFDLLKEIDPDIITVVAYGKMLPKNILDFTDNNINNKYGCVNVHASLLPKYRGASQINAAIINGEKTTGITTIYMDEGCDTGDMILKESIEIDENETFGELCGRLADLGGRLLVETLGQIKDGTAKREKQPDLTEYDGTYAHKPDDNMREIDWSKPVKDIHDQIRGLSPVPAAFTRLNGKKLKIYKSEIEKTDRTDGGVLKILELQLEGGRRMAAKDFLNGNKFAERTISEWGVKI